MACAVEGGGACAPKFTRFTRFTCLKQAEYFANLANTRFWPEFTRPHRVFTRPKFTRPSPLAIRGIILKTRVAIRIQFLGILPSIAY